MPPMRRQLFRSHGSQDEADIELKGNEFRRAFGMIEYKGRLCISILFSVLSGVTPLLMNIFMGDMMTSLVGDAPDMPQPPADGMAPGSDTALSDYVFDVVTDMCLRMVYIVLGMTVVQLLNFLSRAAVGPTYVTSLRQALFTSLMAQDISFFDSTSTGVLISRLSEDVTVVRETYTDKFIQLLQMAAQVVAGLVLAFMYAWRIALVAIAGVAVMTAAFFLGEYCVERMWAKFKDTSSRASSKAEEVITAFRTVKSFDNELYEADLYSSQLWSIHDVLKTTSVIKATQNGLVNLLIWGSVGCVTYYAGYLVLNSDLESGNILVLMMSLMLASMGASQLAGMIDDFKRARVSAAKILSICDRTPDVDRYHGEKLGDVQGKVEFRSVIFKYPSRDEYAIDGLSFTISPGETVALVGESGCGKTTTLSLLQRFYEIESGTILIDDVDITTYSPHSLRAHIAVVPQGPVLFSMSVKENVRFAQPDASDDVITNAAKVGNAHEFISDLPDGYDTVVAQTSLSGGQKQRLCIARAIVADCPILMLDEATAALDTESEQLVQQSLEVFRRGKTAIMVAHRLATVKNADRILVFQNGAVVEEGKHEELLARAGIYANLVKFQLQ
jgi:ABC-type multidrug transport system fused ATPase/permease subunit